MALGNTGNNKLCTHVNVNKYRKWLDEFKEENKNNDIAKRKNAVAKKEEKYKPKVYFHFDIEGVLRGHQFSNVVDMNRYYIDAIKKLKDNYDVNIDICSIADLNSYDVDAKKIIDRFKKLHEIIGDEKHILHSKNSNIDREYLITMNQWKKKHGNGIKTSLVNFLTMIGGSTFLEDVIIKRKCHLL